MVFIHQVEGRWLDQGLHRNHTDVLAGLEAGMETYLVLTGLTTRDEIEQYPFRPSRIVDSIADLVDRVQGSGFQGTRVQGFRGLPGLLRDASNRLGPFWDPYGAVRGV